MIRFRSTENLPRVDETKEENISPNPKNKRRYKLSSKLNFSDKFEDNIHGKKKWMTEIFKYNKVDNQPMFRSGSCIVKPIEEVNS